MAWLAAADAALESLPRAEPSTQASLRVRSRLAREIRGDDAREIMALEEVAEFLRVCTADLEEIAADLPAFELGGHVRVRRSRLIEWIEQRERGYTVQTIESQVARSLAGAFARGVA